jgi:hypothetical protein
MYGCPYRRAKVKFVSLLCVYIFISRNEVPHLWWQHFQEKISGSFQETVKVRQWLELQIRDTELGVITEAVQNEIKILKGYSKLSDITVLTLQEEGMKRQIKGIVKYCYCSDYCVGMLFTDI